jgi:DNA-binding NarL/FixJ family response regulator
VQTSGQPTLTTKGSGKIRIFIIEDSEVTRSALRAILGQEPTFEVAGEAVDGPTAVGKLLFSKAAVALVDIGLPGVNGIDVTREFKQKAPHIKALMFTSNTDDRLMLDAFAAGADGYLPKEGFDRAVLASAIKCVVAGKCWLHPTIAQRILQFAKLFKRTVPTNIMSATVEPLTAEEEKVLQTACDQQGICAVDAKFLTRLQRLSELKK